MMPARKLSFTEAWNSSTIFFINEKLEQEIEEQVQSLLQVATDARIAETAEINIPDIASFFQEEPFSLDVILKDIGLSQEKFLRLVSLLRQLGQISGGFDSEWSIGTIQRKIKNELTFAQQIAELFVDGKRNTALTHHVPRYYLDMLNYREIKGGSHAARQSRYKSALIGTYGGRKGYRVEAKIGEKLEEIQKNYGIGYKQGRSMLIETNIDFAVPNLVDPWVIIMSSFQETTSSGQTTKAKDMRDVYDRVRHLNSRNKQNRVFVNFVDGGGWLARKSDLERLVEECHYFINLKHIDMLEDIILKHVPKTL